jgi:hypothetical protein
MLFSKIAALVAASFTFKFAPFGGRSASAGMETGRTHRIDKSPRYWRQRGGLPISALISRPRDRAAMRDVLGVYGVACGPRVRVRRREIASVTLTQERRAAWPPPPVGDVEMFTLRGQHSVGNAFDGKIVRRRPPVSRCKLAP